MRVLTLNPGSSSLKLAVLDGDRCVANRVVADWHGVAYPALLTEVIEDQPHIDAVGVRFVHGGDRAGPVVLDEAELAALGRLVPLAPLHQARSLGLAALAGRVLSDVPVVGCFDTSFHAGLPAAARTYALPRRWVRDHGLRRYGFHGLSCAYATGRAAQLLRQDPAARPDQSGLRLVCCHVGAGVSVTAIDGGRSVDTSMGFTPLEGAVMATRSGSLDPGLLLYLLDSGVADARGLAHALEHDSGLAGMTGTSGDVRAVLAARERGDHDAALALAVYVHRLRQEIAARATALPRLDALVFTGGVAEHQPGLVAEVVAGLGMLGVAVDAEELAGTGDRVTGPAPGTVRVLVVTAREDVEIARQTRDALAAGAARTVTIPALGAPS